MAWAHELPVHILSEGTVCVSSFHKANALNYKPLKFFLQFVFFSLPFSLSYYIPLPAISTIVYETMCFLYLQN